MSTDISLQKTKYQVGDRSWLLAEPDYKPNVTLAIAAFSKTDNYPDGYIPSGTVIALASSGTYDGLFVPYDSADTTTGAGTAYGLTYGDVQAIRSNGDTATKVGTGGVVYDAVVSVGSLPVASGKKGAVDDDAKTDLAQIRWEA